MTASIKDVILARAGEMAAHDGTAMGIVHVIGAVNQIHLDLARARDELVAGGQVALAELAEAAVAATVEPVAGEPDAAEEPDASGAPDTAEPGAEAAEPDAAGEPETAAAPDAAAGPEAAVGESPAAGEPETAAAPDAADGPEATAGESPVEGANGKPAATEPVTPAASRSARRRS